MVIFNDSYYGDDYDNHYCHQHLHFIVTIIIAICHLNQYIFSMMNLGGGSPSRSSKPKEDLEQANGAASSYKSCHTGPQSS